MTFEYFKPLCVMGFTNKTDQFAVALVNPHNL
jgi:hypothetical protein